MIIMRREFLYEVPAFFIDFTMKIEDEIRQKKFISPYQKAVINLIFTGNWLVNEQQHLFKPFGITGQQFNVLRILKGQHPGSLSAKEIRSRMMDRHSDISRLLDRLLAKKLIEKKSCAEDKRATDVWITETGINLLATIGKRQNDLDKVLRLTEQEAIQLSDLLDKSRG
jgi:DNA-binding MarR family transcriptional regulator